MLGILLISWQNGRTVKTYGLNRLENYNMKFTFICIVIVLSCSVCASGDLEIYPGLKFDLSSQEQRHRLENGDEVPFYGENDRRWPWKNLQIDEWDNGKKEEDFDLELPEQFRNIAEFLQRNQNQLKNDYDLPIYYNPRSSYDDAYEEYRSSEKNRKFDRFNFKYPPSSQILDDVRPYPREDDFSFGDDDVEERETKSPQQHGRHVHEAERPNEKHLHSSHVAQDVGENKNSEEASGKGALEDAKLVDDPSQFAYPPSDSRFFQDVENDNGKQKGRSNLDKLKDNKIRLSHRSGEAFSEENDQVEEGEYRNNDQVEVVAVQPQLANNESTGLYIIAVVAGISAAATVGLIAVGIGWYNLQKHVKNASDVEYPAYGVTGPNKDASPSGDRRLAQSAQMYHYQHQKQQIIAMESRAAAGERHGSVSEADSDEENEEGDYTVYECPGLAPTGEMEVKNPLFQDDPTPAQTPPVKPNGDEKK
ncbi:unnamed protein product [Tenebrio molitor]|jgi:hypothetical protein|nr:unnamed protein product [Tenebrio molitor]